jgi:methyl-accepting chemotaxis protein
LPADQPAALNNAARRLARAGEAGRGNAVVASGSGSSWAIAAAVEEQGATTQEIARSVHQAASGTSQVATRITDVNRGANETGSASAQVLASAQSLARDSGTLKSEVERFVNMVRAA